MAGIHSPSVFKPEDYTYKGAYYTGTDDDMAWSYSGDHQDLIANIGSDAFEALPTQCDSCGSWFAHGVAFQHDPTGDYVGIGHICASDLWVLPDFATKERRRREKAAKTRRENRERKEAGSKWLAEHFTRPQEMIDALEGDDTLRSLAGSKGNYALSVWRDMIGNARKWGSLTERQVAFAEKLVTEVETEIEEAKTRPLAPPRIDVPVTDERITFTGEILSVKWKEGPVYGSGAWKMTVRDDRGFVVWGTMPSSIDGEKGDRVQFDATVKPSDDDPTFGFFSRPTKGTNLSMDKEPETLEELEAMVT